MNPESRTGQRIAQATALACALGLVLAGVLWWTMQDANTKRFTTMFTATVGLYEANDVRIQGVKVGSVQSVVPMGDQVRVELEVDRKYPVPADAKAVIVAPSLVSDRYVQFTPTYQGGAELADGARLGLDRTATPLEVDDLYNSLNRVSKALGPEGANEDGALTRLLETTSANVDGVGKQFNTAVSELAKASRTLSGNKEDLFRTVDNLQQFTTTLAQSDRQVNEFAERLSGVNDFLARERGNLGESVEQLGTALSTVQQFISENRGRIDTNVEKLAGITGVLVDQREALAEILDVAPTGLANLFNTYNASSGTLDARDVFAGFSAPPIVTACTAVRQATPDQLPQTLADICDALAPVVDGTLPLPSVNQVIVALNEGKLPPLPLPLAGEAYGSPAAVQGGN
ncbi:virulence factor Mce-like protein [Tamaricihabitans halophyticus]|uniref:Virulence factor Mce-like protein n=1 Tax=Tamaricihabitans halophyticus TaxID=1262583 RepID=A0A4R2QVR3_9PSEU|nr:MCE family protein [Tamaricihabitans halophyticus]TCP53189.1 virulence factor Mce-like protein [Tamaricihabitans halophyticus]